MRTVQLKSRTVLRSRDPPSTLFVFLISSQIFCLVWCQKKISPSKKPASTHTGGVGIGGYLRQQNWGWPFECGTEICMTIEHTLSSLISIILKPAFSWPAPLWIPTKRFNRDRQKQHKTSSISQVLRKPPILRHLLLNLSTRAKLRASPNSKLDLQKGRPTLTATQGSWPSQN